MFFNLSPETIVVFLASIIVALTIHEFAHAWTADKLGDDTPRLQGRVTLSPLAHLDPVGSLVFILSGFRIGWGKPVQYNPLRLSRKIDELLIALAGPASNLLLALVLNIAIALLEQRIGGSYPVLHTLSAINVLIAAFNMLPIPPLDGSSIVAYFWPEYRSIMGGQIGILVVLGLILTGTVGLFIEPVRTAFFQLVTLGGIL